MTWWHLQLEMVSVTSLIELKYLRVRWEKKPEHFYVIYKLLFKYASVGTEYQVMEKNTPEKREVLS